MADAATNRMRLVWLLPLVALAAGYALGYAHRRVEVPATAREHAPPVAAARTRAPAVAAKAAPSTDRIALPPMPSNDIPLVDAFDSLAARARGGDGAAAVRLLDATLRCARLDNERALAATFQAVSTRHDGGAGSARLIEQARAFAAANESLCKDATQEQTRSAGEWLPLAAAAGDPGSQACYAELGADAMLLPPYASDAWIDAMRRYRDNAAPAAEAAFAAGVPQAAYALYETSAGRYAMMPFAADSAVAPDYSKAYALAQFQATRLAGTADVGSGEDLAGAWRVRAKLLERELSAAEIERAKRWADRETRRMTSRDAPSLPCEGWTAP